ncbi:hypothetical protein [Tautonia rosea]|uniref:hypothetical protein n=1 Tax=Tautonia rosea TaxID=2728037 RepID=UPI001473F9CE|nr:hypothetical protein [Tautonia rosea]
MVRAVRRRFRKARPARLECLEARAMLATGLSPIDPLSEAEPIALAVPSQTITLWDLETPDVVVDQELDTPPALSRVTMSFPWRVSSWLNFNENRPGDRIPLPESDFPFAFDPESAKDLLSTPSIQWEGAVVSGEDGHLFRLTLAPGSRALSFSYAVRFEDRFDASVAALRVSLRDAEGDLIDFWWLDASADRLDVRLLSLVPTGQTTLFFGIEAVGPPTVSDTPISYLLNVRQADPPPVNWFPGSGQTQVESPAVGDEFLNQEVPLLGEAARFSPSILVNLDARQGTEFAMAEFASGRGATIELIAGESGRSSVFAGGLVRPLPMQGASTVGGFLATGPEIRGEQDVSDRLPRIDEFADTLLMASDPVTGGSGEGEQIGGQQIATQVGDSDAEASLADLSALPIELVPESEGQGLARVAGFGAFPMFVMGLRTTRGTPSILTPDQFPLPIPDDLAALVAAIDPPAPVNSEQEAEQSPEEEPDPTRPRVLRTALIGAAALAVGLLLPDLASERTLIRLRPAPRGARWWFFG